MNFLKRGDPYGISKALLSSLAFAAFRRHRWTKAVTQTLKNAIVSPQNLTCLLVYRTQRGTPERRRVQQRFSQKQSTVRTVKTVSHATNAKMCRSITAGTQEDVIEIDAASNSTEKSDLSVIGQIMRLPRRRRTKCTLLMRYICFQQELSMPC